MMLRFFICLLLLLTVSACEPNSDIIPTFASPEAIATGFVLTENAPPSGYDTVSFPRIDAHLEELSGWRYTMEFEFRGRFSGTPREANARTYATVTYQQLTSSRRVSAEVQQDLQGENAPVLYEGVRLGEDTFLVRDGACLSNAAADASALVADLSAGDLIGGVNTATTAAQKQVINGEQVWRYDFALDALRLPNVTLNEQSRILSLVHELWVAPEHNVVIRYYVTMEVEDVIVFASPLPVSGTLIIRYDVTDIGDIPSINVPFGC
jgi:hypothetical protein